MNKELLPCAHCGSKAVLTDTYFISNGDKRYYIKCSKKCVKTENYRYKKSVINKWNKRI